MPKARPHRLQRRHHKVSTCAFSSLNWMGEFLVILICCPVSLCLIWDFWAPSSLLFHFHPNFIITFSLHHSGKACGTKKKPEEKSIEFTVPTPPFSLLCQALVHTLSFSSLSLASLQFNFSLFASHCIHATSLARFYRQVRSPPLIPRSPLFCTSRSQSLGSCPFHQTLLGSCCQLSV